MAGQTWEESEYRCLFGAHPPRGQRPSRAAAEALAREFDRTRAAILAQWDDGASYCGGRPAVASDALTARPDRIGMCDGS